ncbi:MAG: hypothetical protein HGN29_09100 [Asgard group archaeon]|nr:hypothetical protein [Asgard group archaeon]
MDKGRINEVGELLEVAPSNLKESKFKVLVKRLTYPLAQIAFFIFSIISGILLGYWESQIQIGYPFNQITRIYRAGIPTLLIIHSGNTLFSIKNRKKYRISNFLTGSIVIINLILSAISFFFIYKFMDANLGLSASVRYGTFHKNIDKIIISKISSTMKEVYYLEV